MDIPKRQTPAKGGSTYSSSSWNIRYGIARQCSSLIIFPHVCVAGYELLFQPEVVRVYTSLLQESQNPSVLEAAAGAVQNLCAGRWTVSPPSLPSSSSSFPHHCRCVSALLKARS